jgi:hypothetical protein
MSSWISINRPRKRPINTAIITATTNYSNKIKVFYITNVKVGGSFKYINDLIKYFPEVPFVSLSNYMDFQKYSKEFHSGNILILQYLLLSNIPTMAIIDIIRKTQIQVLIPIHDFYYLSSSTNDFTNEIHNYHLISNKVSTYNNYPLLKLAKYIIFPSDFVKNEYLKYITLSNYNVIPHIDYEPNYQEYIPSIDNNNINIGLINELTECKGKDYYIELLKIKKYSDYNIIYHIFTGDKTFQLYDNVIIHPRYDNENIINILHTNNIHSLLFLNKWGETYCYSLTYALMSGISILYNNIGAFTERIPKTIHHFPVEPVHINNYINIDNIIQRFYTQLDYIITNNSKNKFYNVNNTVKIPDFYSKLFAQPNS